MKISKKQLKRIIREEYSKAKAQGLILENTGGYSNLDRNDQPFSMEGHEEQAQLWRRQLEGERIGQIDESDPVYSYLSQHQVVINAYIDYNKVGQYKNADAFLNILASHFNEVTGGQTTPSEIWQEMQGIMGWGSKISRNEKVLQDMVPDQSAIPAYLRNYQENKQMVRSTRLSKRQLKKIIREEYLRLKSIAKH